MKLKMLKVLARILESVDCRVSYWKEEVNWKIISLTPIGPNPHKKGTVEYFLWEHGNLLRAAHRLKAVNSRSPWLTIAKDKQ